MKPWLQATRAISLTAVLAPALAILLSSDEHIALGRTVAALIGMSLLLLGVNMQNDVEDDARGIDGVGSLGGSGVLQAGHISARALQRVAYLLMFAGLLCGLPTLLVAPGPMLALGGATLVGAACYSGKPFGLKYHALGDVTVFLLCGPLLTFGASVAMYGHVTPATWPMGVLFGLAATGILHANNIQDTAVDARAGARTFALLLGQRAARVYFVALYVGALAAWLALRPQPLPLAVGVLGFVPAARLLVRTLRARDLSSLPLLRVEAAQAHLLLGVAVAIACFIGGLS